MRWCFTFMAYGILLLTVITKTTISTAWISACVKRLSGGLLYVGVDSGAGTMELVEGGL